MSARGDLTSVSLVIGAAAEATLTMPDSLVPGITRKGGVLILSPTLTATAPRPRGKTRQTDPLKLSDRSERIKETNA